ncbi:hypothetical protein C8F01DRAFT_1223141 [Mycena amicta]|nr:hypothetical protein C8F01DRAFT_1223141 [Mycena amicta]
MSRFHPRNIPCPHCPHLFKSHGGLTKHLRDLHSTSSASSESHERSSRHGSHSPPHSPADSPPTSPSSRHSPLPRDSLPPSDDGVEQGVQIETHPLLDGTPCDADGNDLPPGTDPPPWDEREEDDYGPFENRAAFKFGEFLYTQEQMSGGNITHLMQLLAAVYPGHEPPFADDKDLYTTIDSIPLGDIPWQSFSVKYTGDLPNGDVPVWMTEKYEVWFRSPLAIFEKQLANPDFKDELDWVAKRIYKDGNRQYTDLFSGNRAWKQSEKIAEDDENHGALFVPVVLGSDKTCVSVGTGNTEFYPLYGGIGNLQNGARCAHREGISLLGFLAIPKASRKHSGSIAFRKFCRQLFHASLARILNDLKPHMTKAKVTRCADRHFRRAIYGIGPVVADYPEQVLYTCVVQGWCPICLSSPDNLDQHSARRCKEHTQTLLEAAYGIKELWDEFGMVADIIPFTADFPRADIHELISLIKGTFKDHLIDWVVEYVETVHEPAEVREILADIDRRIAIMPPFTGLRNFPKGRNFKQWTGDDSKGLMKVFLPAISGRVPSQIVQAVAHFTEFCYLARGSVIDEQALGAMEEAINAFHAAREAFRIIRPDGFSLPRQHSLVHYVAGIRKFGIPNGLCTSIIESKHIKAMLLTNQRQDKLQAAR